MAILTQPGLFDGISPPLTGSQTLDFADIAALSSQLLGREVTRETITDNDYRKGLISHGVPEEMAAALGTIYPASRGREFAVVDPTLERLLGSQPTKMRDVLRDFLSQPESDSH